MDRELVFAVLVMALCGIAVIAAGWWPRSAAIDHDDVSEPEAWRRIWTPFAPAAAIFALLCGWLCFEPSNAEPAPRALMLAAVPFAVIFVRAVWRATRALSIPYDSLTAATTGILRPTIVISPKFSVALDSGALAAATEHERAHARHRDPLRLWLAQFASELMWPAPAAQSRLRSWKRALEIARDDEAREHGIAGADLAAAIVVAMRLQQRTASATAAYLAEAEIVRERVTRLLAPPQPPRTEPRIALATIVVSLAIPLAVFVGTRFGEATIGWLLMKG
jgi:Zn-dependent protease with chaperone function